MWPKFICLEGRRLLVADMTSGNMWSDMIKKNSWSEVKGSALSYPRASANVLPGITARETRRYRRKASSLCRSQKKPMFPRQNQNVSCLLLLAALWLPPALAHHMKPVSINDVFRSSELEPVGRRLYNPSYSGGWGGSVTGWRVWLTEWAEGQPGQLSLVSKWKVQRGLGHSSVAQHLLNSRVASGLKIKKFRIRQAATFSKGKVWKISAAVCRSHHGTLLQLTMAACECKHAFSVVHHKRWSGFVYIPTNNSPTHTCHKYQSWVCLFIAHYNSGVS